MLDKIIDSEDYYTPEEKEKLFILGENVIEQINSKLNQGSSAAYQLAKGIEEALAWEYSYVDIDDIKESGDKENYEALKISVAESFQQSMKDAIWFFDVDDQLDVLISEIVKYKNKYKNA